EDVTAADRLIIDSPSATGLIVMKAMAPEPGLMQQARASLAASNCKVQADQPPAKQADVPPPLPPSRPKRWAAGGRDRLCGEARREFVEYLAESLRLLPLGRVTRAVDHLNLAAPQRRRRQPLQITEIDDLFCAALHDRERYLQVAHDLDFVGK